MTCIGCGCERESLQADEADYTDFPQGLEDRWPRCGVRRIGPISAPARPHYRRGSRACLRTCRRAERGTIAASR